MCSSRALAKQSQSGPAGPGGHPPPLAPPASPLPGRLCDIASMPRFGQQTQTWASWGIWGAGRRGRTKGKCAKQTQFWPRQGEGQVVYGKGVTTNRTCKEHWKNKANLGEVSSVKCQVLSRASRAPSPGSLPTSNFTLHTSNSAEGRSCKTKPIRDLQADPMDPAAAAVYRPHPDAPRLGCRLAGWERCAEKKPASLLAGGRTRRTRDVRPPWCVA